MSRPSSVEGTNVHMRKDTKREAILDAANEQFRQYGYRKTSMDDIAVGLGISRASLYSYFDNKDEIFRGVSIGIHEQGLRDAERRLVDAPRTQNLSMRVANALVARHGPFQKAVTESLHGRELFDEHSRLCGEIALEASSRFQDLLATALRASSRAGAIDLKAVGITAAAAAEILNLATAGLKRGAPDCAVFEKRVRALVKVFVAGLR